MERTNRIGIGTFSAEKTIAQIRKNHALEHAVVHVLEKKFSHCALAGYSINKGFWVIGKLAIQDVQEAVDAAYARLAHGEKDLAIHQGCGTNLAATGLAVSLGSLLTMAGTRSEKERLSRLSSLILVTTACLQLSKPLGVMLQRNVTTDPDMTGLSIRGIDAGEIRGVPYFFVNTAYDE